MAQHSSSPSSAKGLGVGLAGGVASSDSSPSSSELEAGPAGGGVLAPPPVMAARAAVSGWSSQRSAGILGHKSPILGMFWPQIPNFDFFFF